MYVLLWAFLLLVCYGWGLLLVIFKVLTWSCYVLYVFRIFKISLIFNCCWMLFVVFVVIIWFWMAFRKSSVSGEISFKINRMKNKKNIIRFFLLLHFHVRSTRVAQFAVHSFFIIYKYKIFFWIFSSVLYENMSQAVCRVGGRKVQCQPPWGPWPQGSSGAAAAAWAAAAYWWRWAARACCTSGVSTTYCPSWVNWMWACKQLHC